MVGDVYYDFTVVSESFIRDGRSRVLCRCKCGREEEKVVCRLKLARRCRYCGKDKNAKYHIGDTYGRLTLVKKLKNRRFLVKCECGKQHDIAAGTWKKVLSCGCIREDQVGIKHHSYLGYKYISKVMWNSIVRGAKIRNIKVEITIEFINDLLVKQNFKCAITGLPIFIGNFKNKSTASLDRIDSSKDYTIDNIWWVHKDVNKMKWDFDLDYFKYMCKLVVEPYNESN